METDTVELKIKIFSVESKLQNAEKNASRTMASIRAVRFAWQVWRFV